MECYACDNEATRQCRRCARVYCDLHGDDLCAECLNPASALPSFNLYRGSLLALLIGTAIALWLLVQPPATSTTTDPVVLPITPTPDVTEVLDTPAPTLGRTVTPTGTATPDATITPTPRTYTVRTGDALFGIAEQFAPEGVSGQDYAQQIADANGIDLRDAITVGQILILP